MSWSLILSNYNSILSFYVLVLLSFLLCPCRIICLIPTLSSILSHVYMFFFLVHLCPSWWVQWWSRGKSRRLVAKGSLIESPLVQFVLKTRAVNFVLGNSNMIGKIPTWWENSDRGNRKTAGKNLAMVGNFPQWEKKSLPLHWSFSTAAPVLYAGIYLPLFSQWSF